MGNHMILLFCFTADYVCTYRKPYSHYHGSHGVLNCMRSSSFTCSALHLKGTVTYIEGNRFSNSSNTESSLLLDHYISYFILLLTKWINYENTRPTDSCILKKMNIATSCWIQSGPAECLTLTLATDRGTKHPLQNCRPC